jgi:hypothetical protein
MFKFIIKYLILLFISVSFSSIKIAGNSSIYSNILLSAQTLSRAGSINYSSNLSLSIFTNPVVKKTSQQLIGFNRNSYFSNEFSSSLFIFPQKYFNNWNYNIGIIHISIPKIPNTQYLFENDVPNYDNISYFNHVNFGLLLNFSSKIYEDYNFGINFIPHFSSLSNKKSYGLIYNIGVFYPGFENIEYGIIINSVPGSFTFWENNSIELFPFELIIPLIYKIGKVNINSNINYFSNQKEKVEYSIGIDFNLADNLKLILGNSKKIKYSAGFIFSYQGITIEYGAGYQKLETFNMFHHGVDLVFNLNMANKWQKLLEP